MEEKNVKIWAILNEGGGTQLEERYCLAIHKSIQTAIHHEGQIILCMEDNLNVTLDEQLEYLSKVDMSIPAICHISKWDKNIVYFTKNGYMYIFEFEK